ncbi:3-oxoacyl-[acyl-carrier-protein] synthase, mitochondrial-like protein [Drosera capensis]
MDGFDRETRDHVFNQLTSKVAAVVPIGGKEREFDESVWVNWKDQRSISRFIGYALCASDEALRDANWVANEQGEKERTGVCNGSGIGSICDIVDAAQLICEKRLRRLTPYFVPRILINLPSGHVSMKYGFQGDADIMVAGGTEASIDALSIAGFCRIGDGCGVVVLEVLEHAKDRDAKIYAEVGGYEMSGDAYHITQPHNDGRGAMLAMSLAIQQANLHLHKVDYINAHATSTPLGDAIEANAIKSLFGEHATSGDFALSSTTGAAGYLGAAGAEEAIFTILAMHHGSHH